MAGVMASSSTILPTQNAAHSDATPGLAGERESERAPHRDSRANLAWLLPWLIASIGILTTLALLR